MIRSLYEAQKVCLAALDPEVDAALLARWTEDADFLHTFDENPARPLSASQVRKKLEADDKSGDTRFLFSIRELSGNRMVGTGLLRWIEFNNRVAYLDLTIGDAADRGCGYGREALHLLIRYAFDELSLHSLVVSIFEYNVIALHLLEGAGFTIDARSRKAIRRGENRFDLLWLSLLELAWRARLAAQPEAE